MTYEVPVKCPDCSTISAITIPEDIVNDIEARSMKSPEVRSKLKPISQIPVYRITSDEIRVFLDQKLKVFTNKQDSKLLVRPLFPKPNKEDGSIKFAAMQIAFSKEIEQNDSDNDFYTKIGTTVDRVNILDKVYLEFIKRYQFTNDEINAWLKYDNLEELENKFGISEKFINELKRYCRPVKGEAKNTEDWIFFNAKVDEIISNMLEDTTSKKVNGSIEIKSIKRINDNLLEFIVYVHPTAVKTTENPFVRKFMESVK